jgi:hypothetical protein
MATEKLNLSELKKMIISEAEKIMSLGDPLGVDMNKMTNPGNSTGDALVMTKGTGGFVKKSAAPEAAENIDDTEEPLEVDMNEMDGDQGHDEQIAAAVKVDAASSTKKGASVEGMKNANFESKDKNPSTASSAPFEEREDKVEMNSQDKADNGGAKTYVEPGAELHKGASTGQHKANYSEKAQNERETAERIAQAIQLPESFKNKAELISFINEEAKRLSNALMEGEKNLTNELFGFGGPTEGDLVVINYGDGSTEYGVVGSKGNQGFKVLWTGSKDSTSPNNSGVSKVGDPKGGTTTDGVREKTAPKVTGIQYANPKKAGFEGNAKSPAEVWAFYNKNWSSFK